MVKASTGGAALGGISPKLDNPQSVWLALREQRAGREVGMSESREGRPKEVYVVNKMD